MAEAEKEEVNVESGPKTEEGTPSAEGQNTEEDSGAGSKKKKMIILGAVVILILISVPVTLHFTGIFPLFGSKKHEETDKDKKDEHGEGKHDSAAKPGSDLPPPPVTLDLDEFLVNLDTPGKQARFLKMAITLELPSDAEKEAIKPYIPRIRDSFQLYLRELREEDVKGSAALYRLREELMLRLAKVVYPIKVNDILFKEILTQ
jgi:flagellar FliL protein